MLATPPPYLRYELLRTDMTDSDPALADYAVVLIGAVFAFATASWLISAHKWFKGPVCNLEPNESSSDLDRSSSKEQASM